jgi:hypothetical protein
MPYDIECNVEFNVDDNLACVRAMLRRLTPILQADTAGSFRLDLTKCRYLGPDAAAILLSITLEARRRRQSLHVDLPVAPAALRAFCRFSGLQHHLTGAAEPDVNDPRNVTVPLRVITRANFRDADPLIELVRRHAGISNESAEYLRLCVNEVTQNVEDHANSAIGGVCCARYLSNQQQVRVAIVDRGEGIATTLRQKYPAIQDAPTALASVVAGGFSTRSRPNNAGLGLSQLWNSVRHLAGAVVLLSEGGFAEHRAGWMQDRIDVLDPPFPGTAIFFTLPVDTHEDHSRDD